MKEKVKDKAHSSFLFDAISGVYGLFYKYQQKNFEAAIKAAKPKFDITMLNNGLDVGCGTGALCSILCENGLNMTGIDNSQKMLNIAAKKNIGSQINFMHHNAAIAIPFSAKEFDFTIASYVAHGLIPEARKAMLCEMKRVSKSYVILHEFNKKRKLAIDIAEWLEGRNYFYFIKNIETELNEIFDEYEVIEINETSFWYVCKV